MGYRSLGECVLDLEAAGQLVRLDHPVDPYLEAAHIQRRVHQARGPAILFENPKGCRFPILANLFGTLDRTRFLFRDALEGVRRLIELKIDPSQVPRAPIRNLAALRAGWNTRIKRVSSGPVLANETSIDRLPQIQSWPADGGAFIHLPQVYTEDVRRPGFGRSNLGMYRIQLSGGRYEPNVQIGLHYQIHRGIGVHQAAAIEQGVPFRVNIFVGGPPAMTLAAVMPLPEGLSELIFAGALGGRRVRMISFKDRLPIAADADFCITGTVEPGLLLPEGPFGDHLGYYSQAHDFPVLRVEHVYHRDGAIWPFTTVGRPPQEDSSFGAFIHELTGPVIPTVVGGIHAVSAVDAAGVHPLLLAIGSERYTPYSERRRPQELLTSAHALLGQGQLSLAKFLLIVAKEDDPRLDIHDVPAFLTHLLARIDWTNDLHFQTHTTIDTLDYSGGALNQGSKVVMAAVGPPRRTLATDVPGDLRLPEGFADPRVCLPGVLAVEAPRFAATSDRAHARRFCERYDARHPINGFPWIVLVDDSGFVSASLENFLWVTFTRSNPAADIDGIEAFIEDKHWGCRGSLVVDARAKPHHAPPLVDDPQINKRIDSLGAPGGPLHGLI